MQTKHLLNEFVYHFPLKVPCIFFIHILRGKITGEKNVLSKFYPAYFLLLLIVSMLPEDVLSETHIPSANSHRRLSGSSSLQLTSTEGRWEHKLGPASIPLPSPPLCRPFLWMLGKCITLALSSPGRRCQECKLVLESKNLWIMNLKIKEIPKANTSF